MSKRALVTGGAGFIGSNLVAKLLGGGWEVVVLDNLSRRGSEKNLAWLLENYRSSNLEIEIKDVRDFNSVRATVGDVDVIFHLAAQTAVTTSFVNPREDFEVNALGSFNVLEAARQMGHKPIVIYSSTNKVYGRMEKVRVRNNGKRYSYIDSFRGIDEEYPLDFHSPYGCSNGVADQYTRDYYRMYGIPTVVFRQSCIYGPRQMGMEDQGWVAHFALSAHFGRPITVYGDGKQVRDLLYIDDLISAYLTSVEKIDNAKGEVYNIGGGPEYSLSILECLLYLEKLVGKKPKVQYSDWRPGDQKVYISNNSKLKKELGWSPQVHHKDGLNNLYQWIKENEGILR